MDPKRTKVTTKLRQRPPGSNSYGKVVLINEPLPLVFNILGKGVDSLGGSMSGALNQTTCDDGDGDGPGGGQVRAAAHAITIRG